MVIRNLTIRIIPEEVYIVSHHVHHAYSEQAGDPYNVHGGRLYCLLAAELHQGIARDLSPADYARAYLPVRMAQLMGVLRAWREHGAWHGAVAAGRVQRALDLYRLYARALDTR